MKAPDLKSIAIIAAAAAGVYVVYKVIDALSSVGKTAGKVGNGIGDTFKAVFTSAKHDPLAKSSVHIVATARNAIEQQLLNGQITVEQAERAEYPERFATTTTTNRHGTLTHVGSSGLGIGGTISIPNQNPFLR